MWVVVCGTIKSLWVSLYIMHIQEWQLNFEMIKIKDKERERKKSLKKFLKQVFWVLSFFLSFAHCLLQIWPLQAFNGANGSNFPWQFAISKSASLAHSYMSYPTVHLSHTPF